MTPPACERARRSDPASKLLTLLLSQDDFNVAAGLPNLGRAIRGRVGTALAYLDRIHEALDEAEQALEADAEAPDVDGRPASNQAMRLLVTIQLARGSL